MKYLGTTHSEFTNMTVKGVYVNSTKNPTILFIGRTQMYNASMVYSRKAGRTTWNSRIAEEVKANELSTEVHNFKIAFEIYTYEGRLEIEDFHTGARYDLNKEDCDYLQEHIDTYRKNSSTVFNATFFVLMGENVPELRLVRSDTMEALFKGEGA